ncbi:MAG: HNH endonuclease, partial [Dehalococcoidia bacterium]
VDPAEAHHALAAVFPELAGARELPDAVRLLGSLAEAENRKFSPGAMANPPDRLDGFHTYNLCCRAAQDTGRTAENLGTYGVDRRAYEQWCEGDWAAADALMSRVGVGRCPRPNCQSGGSEVQLTADHVGPISLGFRHSPQFVVACRTCNSGKGNRMSLADVQTLNAWETASGESETSWQARELWDAIKMAVRDDNDALRLSRLMRINQHQYMAVLSLVADRGATDAVYRYLSPQYAENRYYFDGLDSTTLRYQGVVANRRQDVYTRSKKARAVRIAYDALREYGRHDDRSVHAVAASQLAGPLRELNRALNRLLLIPSRFRATLNAALARGDVGRDEAIAAVLDLGADASEALVAARDAVARAIERYMRAVGTDLVARYRAGTHMRPDGLTRGRRRTTMR